MADFADIFTGRLISEIPLALAAICDALKDKTSLVELNLSDNAFGGRSVDPIVPFLLHNRSLQILKLSNNGLGPAGGAIIAGALLESARAIKAEGKQSNLRVVMCGRNRLENGSAPAWAEAFAAHGTLVEVRMPQNGIRMAGITRLAEGLSKCPDLQHIDMQDNTFTEESVASGVRAWTDALSSWPHLHTLNLSDCVLSADGEVPSLITALSAGSNPKLHTLQLQNNNLTSKSFGQLADAISAHLSNLMTLELQWNEFDDDDDDEHVETLADSLKQRGGKLFISDEDEEEGVETATAKDEGEESNVGLEKQDSGPDKVIAPTSESDADDLADLMGKIKISRD